MYPDAIPFPFGQESRGIERFELAVLDRVCKHDRPEGSRITARRLIRAPVEPREQFDIGRLQSWPDQLDLLRVLAAQRRDSRLGKTCRDADAQLPGDELE